LASESGCCVFLKTWARDDATGFLVPDLYEVAINS